MPNISSMSDEELRELIDKLTAEEQEGAPTGGGSSMGRSICSGRSSSTGFATTTPTPIP